MILSTPQNPPEKQINNLTSEMTYTNDIWTLKLCGEINANTTPLVWVENILQSLKVTHGQLVIIDLTAVERVDAYGFRFLLRLKRELTNHYIEIVLQNPSPNLRHLLRILKFDDIFEVRTVH